MLSGLYYMIWYFMRWLNHVLRMEYLFDIRQKQKTALMKILMLPHVFLNTSTPLMVRRHCPLKQKLQTATGNSC